MRRHGELPREAGLQLRMGVALALSLGLLAAVVGGLLYLALFVPDGWSLGAMVLVLLGVGAGAAAQGRKRWERRPLPEGAERRLRRATQRLAVVADEPVPRTRVIHYAVPLSWTFAPLRRAPTVHVTTGLLARLEDRELEAVVAHELAHLIHRDAVVMTLIGGPPAFFFASLRYVIRFDPFRGWIAALVFGAFLGPVAVVMLLLSRVVSRHRELAADRVAALLTGSPAAVAAALLAVDDGVERERHRDLRHSASLDAFHFVPVRLRRGIARLWATHPPLRARVERMERLEAGMQR